MMGRQWLLQCFPVILTLSALTLWYIWKQTDGLLPRVYITAAFVIMELSIIVFLLILVFWGVLA